MAHVGVQCVLRGTARTVLTGDEGSFFSGLVFQPCLAILLGPIGSQRHSVQGETCDFSSLMTASRSLRGEREARKSVQSLQGALQGA